VGPPATISLKVVRSPEDLEPEPFATPDALYFVGSTSPQGHLLPVVGGVALGFGAQSIVKDTLTGFFILLENQFGVGDNVEIQTPSSLVAGRVEALTLRVTSLRAFDGTLHFVPNGNILVASNRSKGWARAIVDVRAAYGEDVDLELSPLTSQTTTIDLAPGTYQLICRFHEQLGMKGTLQVA
jgi:hypothetical protein